MNNSRDLVQLRINGHGSIEVWILKSIASDGRGATYEKVGNITASLIKKASNGQ